MRPAPEFLATEDGDVVAALLALTADEPEVRVEAARSLGDLGRASAAPALLQATSDPDLRVHRAAAGALARIGPSAIPALVEALGDQDEQVRGAAAETLHGIGEPAVPPLMGMLRHPDRRARRAARAVLAGIGTPAAQAALRQEQLELWIPVIGFGIGALLVALWLISMILAPLA